MSLPTPYYQDDAVTLYHGDCRDILPSLGRFDLLCTDPPYGHGEKWSGGTWADNPIYADAFKWDAKPVDLALLLSAIDAADRAIVWGGNYYALPPSRSWLSWVKTSQMPTMADFELAWTNLDRPSKMITEDRNPDGKRVHPTQKPLNVMLWCLSLGGGQTVLDPFAGSGTTLRAAKDLGRRAVGIEISEKYCGAIASRLSQNVLDFGGVA